MKTSLTLFYVLFTFSLISCVEIILNSTLMDGGEGDVSPDLYGISFVDAPTYNFGSALIGQTVEHAFEITNVKGRALTGLEPVVQ